MTKESSQSRKAKPKAYEDHEERVQKAVTFMREHPEAKFKHVGNEFHLAPNTVKNRLLGRTKPRRLAHESMQKLKPSEEKAVVGQIQKLDEQGAAPNAKQVRELGMSVLRRRLSPSQVRLGSHWPTRLRRRYPVIAARPRRKLERVRKIAQNKKTVEKFFKLLYDVIHRHHIQTSDIYNADQKGYQIGAGSNHREVVYCNANNFNPQHVDGGRGLWVTIFECVSATGQRLPGFYIYPGAAFTFGKFSEKLNGDVGHAHTRNGWTDRYVSYKWMVDHFLVHAPPSAPGRKRLLLMDNHNSQNTKDFQKACHDDDVLLMWYPSHLTHLLQPLDVAVFSKFDRAVGQRQEDFFRTHPLFQPITIPDFLEIAESARKSAITPEVVKAGFRRAGIHPFNKLKILEDPTIQWHLTSPHSLATSLELRSLPHRLPPPTEINQISSRPASDPTRFDDLKALAESYSAKIAILEDQVKAFQHDRRPVDKRTISAPAVSSQRTIAAARDARLREEEARRNRKKTKINRQTPRRSSATAQAHTKTTTER